MRACGDEAMGAQQREGGRERRRWLAPHLLGHRQSDAKGANKMDRDMFNDSMFEIADVWSEDLEESSYVEILRRLFEAVTEGNPPSLVDMSALVEGR